MKNSVLHFHRGSFQAYLCYYNSTGNYLPKVLIVYLSPCSFSENYQNIAWPLCDHVKRFSFVDLPQTISLLGETDELV